MSTSLGVDIGFGDNKIVVGSETGIKHMYKFPSVCGRVSTNALVNDPRIHFLKDKGYYVGDIALKLESEKIIDVMSYANLETYTPLFLAKIMQDIGENPDIIIAGLSIAHIAHSGYYKEVIYNTCIKDLKMSKDTIIEVLPQGIGAKLAFDKYGDQFPGTSKDFTDDATYVGCDIGFNTLDIFQVLKGKTSPNVVRGIENRGVIQIVVKLLKYIKETNSHEFSIKEGKDIVDEGYYIIRGKKHDLTSVIKEYKEIYLRELEAIIEQHFGKVLDKAEFLNLFGGGAYIFKDIVDSFRRVPANKCEYYNAIGYFERGISLIK